MFNKIGQALIEHHLVDEVTRIGTGIEVERDRTTLDGHLSRQPYPKGIGQQATNPWITNDFMETMSEVVTPPATADLDTLHYSYELTLALRQALAKDEMLWPMSMPPILPKVKDESLLAKASPKKRAYIEGLYHRYGVSKQTPCGVHINVSLSSSVLDFILHHFHTEFKDEAAVKNFIYPIIAQGFIKYRWLLTYLFGASPVAQANYFEAQQGPDHPIRSIRQSKYGYPTSFAVDYSSVENYAQKILAAVHDGKIMSIAEFYGAVRFKGNKDLRALSREGIKYLELRMFDLDPTSEVALKISTLRFIRLMMVYFTLVEPIKNENVNLELKRADEMNANVALEQPDQLCEYRDEAHQFISRLRSLTNQLALGPEYLEVLNSVEEQIDHPSLTLNGYLNTQIQDGSLLDFGVQKGRLYQNDALQSDYHFTGFINNDGDLSAKALADQLRW